ncbi:MAG: hypothetical protein BWY31_00811 [Lentisphaerae bacterium ADurb.Bin242]|nr:MAG: hypothetical protein BWY31_00811 [Lentisphaerae bacterium ADurb.Bin242]
MDKFPKNPVNHVENDGNELVRKVDPRVLFLSLRAYLPYLLLGLVGLLIFLTFLLIFVTRNSMTNWTAVAKLFHQTRSDRVPSFYKQLDSKSIAELVGTHGTLRRAAQRLNLKPSEIASQLSLVVVETDKNKPNIIMITAQNNKPKMAAEIANAVAEAGVEEYIELQNSTLKSMLNERKRRKAQLLTEITALETEISTYTSKTTSFPPDEEVKYLRSVISELLLKVQNAHTKASELRVKIEEIQKNLKVVDKEIQYMHKVHGNDQSELHKMKKELLRLQQLYTPKNPKVINFAEEVQNREKLISSAPQTPDEIIYSFNQVYLSLQENLILTTIDLKGCLQNIADYQVQLDKAREESIQTLKRMPAYNELSRKIESLKNSIRQLETSINDLDFLLNSTIPDLSILEVAVPPRAPNRRNIYLLAVFLSFFIICGLAVVVLFYEIFFGKIKSVQEMKLITSGDILGEIPSETHPKIGEPAVQSAMLASFNALTTALEEKKMLFVGELDETDCSEKTMGYWLEHFGVTGIKTFRLKIVPSKLREKFHFPNAKEPQRAPYEEELICIEKFANRGIFVHSDDLFLAPAECNLLQADLSLLENHYDLLILELAEPCSNSGQLFAQISSLADYSVLFALFNQSQKETLRQLIQGKSEESEKEKKMGVILLGVTPPYWRA